MMKVAVLLLFIFSLPSYGQSQKVSGVLMDADTKAPIQGVTVKVVGTNTVTQTDEKGAFTIKAVKGQTLLFSYIGYEDMKVVIQNNNVKTFTLKATAAALSDVVVVGFGTQRKSDVTSAISTVDVDKTLSNQPFTDIGKGLQGAVPGLQITYSNGALTTAPSVVIRGGVSINGGSPLILVDGIAVSDIGVVNPNDIATISVLKDASSTSIYGSNAAAGVVLITTKSGKRGSRFSLNYNGNMSWSTPTNVPSFADPLVEIPMEDGAMQRAGAGYWGQFGMGGSVAGINAELNGIKNWEQNYKGKESGNNMTQGQDYDLLNSSGNPSATGSPYFYRLWDPVNIMYQTMQAQTHALNASGGTDKLSYYISGTYSSQEGLLKPNPDKLSNYQVMAGITADATPWLTLSAKISDRQHNYYTPYMTASGSSAGAYGDVYYNMWRWGSYIPYGTSTYNGQNYYWRSPLAMSKLAGNSQSLYNTVNSLLSATVKIKPWLTLQSDFNYLYESEFAQSYAEMKAPIFDWFSSSFNQAPVYNNGLASSLDFYSTNNMGDFYTDLFATQITSNTYLTFNQKFGLHNLKVTAGLNAMSGESRTGNFGGYGLISGAPGELNFLLNLDGSARNAVQRTLQSATGGTPDYKKYPSISGGHSQYASAGYFARANYSYADKYLLEVAARYDGSSYYPAGDRWAFFPSISAGWNITKEKFAESINKVVSNWKLRASYGSNGNPVAADYLPLMASGINTWLLNNNTLAQYVGLPANIPASLTWEKVNKFNIGTDVTFLKGDMTATFDWFQNTTSGMITSGVTIPQTFGAAAALQNNGTMRTRGFELGLNYQHRFRNGLQVYGNANLFNFVSVITKIGGNPANSLAAFPYYNGNKVGTIWGFQTVGFFKDANDVASSPSQTTLQTSPFKFGPGDIKYADLNGDNKVDAGASTLADHGDLKIIGNTTPRYQYSFRLGANWKGFDIDGYFQGVGSRQIWATGAIAIPDYGANGELLGNQMDISTAHSGTNADVLSPTTVNQNAWWPNPYYGSNVSQISGESYWANTPGASGNNFYPQTKYLLNLAYLRLKTLTIGYTVPLKYTKMATIQKLRFYVQGMNILTFSHNNHVPIDPEVTSGSSFSSAYYGENSPIDKTYSFGVQVTF
jgi:TonB-linked SusC/RagA family outer membrane protein